MHLDSANQVDAKPAFGCRDDASMVETISDHVRTTDDLGAAFSLIGQDISMGPQVRFRIVLEGQSQPLYPVVYEHAYQIGREALLNAFRHSQASWIELHLEYTATGLSMAVRDNGKGISAELLRKGCEGLSWMKGMSDRIGAKLKLLSRIKAGTEVLLSIPGHIAFAAETRARRELAVA